MYPGTLLDLFLSTELLSTIVIMPMLSRVLISSFLYKYLYFFMRFYIAILIEILETESLYGSQILWQLYPLFCSHFCAYSTQNQAHKQVRPGTPYGKQLRRKQQMRHLQSTKMSKTSGKKKRPLISARLTVPVIQRIAKLKIN